MVTMSKRPNYIRIFYHDGISWQQCQRDKLDQGAVKNVRYSYGTSESVEKIENTLNI
jgi:hypothetical protein